MAGVIDDHSQHMAVGSVDANDAHPRVERVRRRFGGVPPEHFDRAVGLHQAAVMADEDFAFAGADVRRLQPAGRLFDGGGNPLERGGLPRRPLSGRIRVVDHGCGMRVRCEKENLLNVGRFPHAIPNEIHRFETERAPQIERDQREPVRIDVEQQNFGEKRVALADGRSRAVRIAPEFYIARGSDLRLGGGRAEFGGKRRRIRGDKDGTQEDEKRRSQNGNACHREHLILPRRVLSYSALRTTHVALSFPPPLYCQLAA